MELIRLLYGKRSEELMTDERVLEFEDLEVASEEVEAEASVGDSMPPRSPKWPWAGRKISQLTERIE